MEYRKNVPLVELTGTLKQMDEKLDILTALFRQNYTASQTSLDCADQDGNHTTVTETSSGAHVIASSTFQMVEHVDNQHGTLPPFFDTSRILEELSLAQRHSTAPQHLLSWPCSPLKLSEPELQYPLVLEIRRQKLSRSTAPPRCLASHGNDVKWVCRLSLFQLNSLTRFYFSYFQPTCLLLDESKFYSHHLNQAMRNNFDNSIDACIVLLVCALGTIVAYHEGCEEWAQTDELEIGLGFFNLATEMFDDIEAVDWTSVQCLLLMR